MPYRNFLAAALLSTTPLSHPEEAAAQEPVAAPSLQAELDERAASFAATAPAPMQEAFREGIEEVRRTGLVESAKNVGDKAPSGVLLDADGGTVAFDELYSEGPIVVSFYRGGWCPYCNLQLRGLQRSLGAIEGAGARLVAISPEVPEKAGETAEKNELSFLVLTDNDNTLARQFGVVFELPEVIRPIYEQRIGLAAYNGNDKNELPLAATYVIDRNGMIRWAFLDADYKKRAEPADIVAAVKEVAGD